MLRAGLYNVDYGADSGYGFATMLYGSRGIQGSFFYEHTDNPVGMGLDLA